MTAGRGDHGGRAAYNSEGERDQAASEESIRQTLQAERSVAVSRVRTISAELDGIIADAVDANGDDEHDPEGSTVAYERAQVTALLAEARSRLREVDGALTRLANGSYATCEACGGPIPQERLVALPATRTCVGCAGVG